ncbi:MAG: type VII secretion integral membrane protein EccD, partial [Mycobacterium sp.]
MLASDPGLRRVSVHADAAVVDLVLPAKVPVAVLIPSIVDILHDADGFEFTNGSRYQLSRPGGIPFEASTTLADNGIRDGNVMVLSPPPAAVVTPLFEDAAEAVSATLTAAARAWGCPQTRLAGAVAATLLTGIGCVALVRNALPRNGMHASAVAAAAGFVALLLTVFAHRIYREPITGLALGLIATAFAAVAGILAVPGAPGLAAWLAEQAVPSKGT